MVKTLKARKINLIIFKRTLLTGLIRLEPSHKTGLIYEIAFQRIRLSIGFLWGSYSSFIRDKVKSDHEVKICYTNEIFSKYSH